MFVQFTDKNETVISSMFSCQQDSAVWPNQGEVVTSDPRYKVYYDAQLDSVKASWPTPVTISSQA